MTGNSHSSDTWTILLPGPSLEDLILDEKECGPIVAVNSALLHPVRRVDYWSVGDKPNSVHYPCRKRAATLRPTVVTAFDRVSLWEKWFDLQLRTTRLADGYPGGQDAATRAIVIACAAHVEVEGVGAISMGLAILGAVGTGKAMAGTTLTRTWKGREIQATRTSEGWEHDGVAYRSLSAVVKAVTGSHASGPAWFGLKKMRRGNAER